MGKAGKWLRSLLTGKKDEKKEAFTSPLPPPEPEPATKEKKRWSFRRSAAAGRSSSSSELTITAPVHRLSEADIEQRRNVMAIAVATAAAADAAVAAAQAAAAVIRLSAASAHQKPTTAEEEAAATRIQSAFRGYLVLLSSRLKSAFRSISLLQHRSLSFETQILIFTTKSLQSAKNRLNPVSVLISSSASSLFSLFQHKYHCCHSTVNPKI